MAGGTPRGRVSTLRARLSGSGGGGGSGGGTGAEQAPAPESATSAPHGQQSGGGSDAGGPKTKAATARLAHLRLRYNRLAVLTAVSVVLVTLALGLGIGLGVSKMHSSSSSSSTADAAAGSDGDPASQLDAAAAGIPTDGNVSAATQAAVDKRVDMAPVAALTPQAAWPQRAITLGSPDPKSPPLPRTYLCEPRAPPHRATHANWERAMLACSSSAGTAP